MFQWTELYSPRYKRGRSSQWCTIVECFHVLRSSTKEQERSRWQIQHFCPYLYGVRFTLRTDNAALKWLLNFQEPKGQVARWLQEYDCEIQHRAGVKHFNDDALSKRPCLEDACKHSVGSGRHQLVMQLSSRWYWPQKHKFSCNCMTPSVAAGSSARKM